MSDEQIRALRKAAELMCGMGYYAESQLIVQILAARRTVSALEARLKIADDCCDRLMQACTDAGCPDGVRMDNWIRRTVSGQEAEWWEVTTDGEREVVSADHYHRHDWPRSTARPLFAAPIPATELSSERLLEIVDRYATVHGDELVEFARAIVAAQKGV